MNKLVTLYGFAYGDRSGRIRWLFEELGVNYEDHFLNWESQEHKSAEYLKLNPMGRVPTIRYEGRTFQEAGAICMNFTDMYSSKGLAPNIDSPLRADYYQWIFFASSTLEPLLEKMWRAKEAKDTKAEDGLGEDLKAASIMLETALSGRNFLVGNEFSTADIMIGSILNWNEAFLRLSPMFKPYFERLKARPACRRSRIFD
jgi:glutathione S-transferase